jgi:hypothetical protein
MRLYMMKYSYQVLAVKLDNNDFRFGIITSTNVKGRKSSGRWSGGVSSFDLRLGRND